MVFAAVVLVFAAKIAFIRLSGYRTGWMSTQSQSAGYQRISHPEVQDEGDIENGVHEETRRTLLPQSSAEYRNNWQVD
ncbi:hypothetical protein AAEP93_006124 [Penicillium crustosum]